MYIYTLYICSPQESLNTITLYTYKYFGQLNEGDKDFYLDHNDMINIISRNSTAKDIRW